MPTKTSINKTTKHTEEVKPVIDMDTIAALIEQNKVLMQQNTELQTTLKEMMTKPTVTEPVISTEDISYESEEEIPEPPANKQIKLISLTYGKLNLASANGSDARKVRFTEYGQVRNVLYSTLIDIINTNPQFAENGAFYITDKNAVYHLGLSSAYKKIQTQKVLDNIYTYDEPTIKAIYDGLSDVQKDNCIYGLALRMSQGENIDANKIDILNRVANVNIRNKVDELQKAPRL